ncbi:hypothetical protein CANCADRAFT_16566, partial [Tortispora caseinolytica NRRL Y-17796]
LRDSLILDPRRILEFETHRWNTYIFIHLGLGHLIMDLLALLPLLSKIESEYGSIQCVIILLNMATFPAIAYTVVSLACNLSTRVAGSSGVVFSIIGIFAIREHKAGKSLTFGDVSIPAWTSPLFLLFLVAFIMPRSSLLGHLFGLLYGYAYGLGYASKLNAPDWILQKVESIIRPLTRRVKRYVPH